MGIRLKFHKFLTIAKMFYGENFKLLVSTDMHTVGSRLTAESSSGMACASADCRSCAEKSPSLGACRAGAGEIA